MVNKFKFNFVNNFKSCFNLHIKVVGEPASADKIGTEKFPVEVLKKK